MKKYIFLTLTFSFLIFQAKGFSQQSRFDQANSLLAEGQYQQAIEHYQSIADDGYYSGALWQNLGVAYARLDSLGKAKYYFLRAKQHSETKQQAANALSYVNNRFPRQSAVLPTLPWVRFINFLSNTIGLNTLVISGLIFLYLGVALKIGSWFRLDLKSMLSNSGYTAIGVSLVLFLFSIVIQYQENRYSTGVMIDHEGQVYQRPLENSTVVSTAYEGYTMQVDENESENQTNWKYVRLENGMYGWIQNDHIMTF